MLKGLERICSKIDIIYNISPDSETNQNKSYRIGGHISLSLVFFILYICKIKKIMKEKN